MNKYIKMAIATMITVYVANWLSSNNATARRWLKGSVVSGAGDVGQSNNNVVNMA